LAVLRSLADGMSVRYVYGLVRPLLFAPPLFDWAAIVAVPGLALNLLSRLPFMRGPDQAYSLVPMTFLCLATVRTAARFALRAAEPRRVTAAMAFAIVVLAGVLPSLPSTARRAPLPVPPIEATRALILAIPSEAPVYAPMTLYSAMCNREYFGSWYTVLERGREPELRGRYAYVVLWPKGEAVWEREAPLLDSLLADPRFVRREGFEPFVVFERR
jgi:hypothetical protein